jgi:hypothetical protein
VDQRNTPVTPDLGFYHVEPCNTRSLNGAHEVSLPETGRFTGHRMALRHKTRRGGTRGLTTIVVEVGQQKKGGLKPPCALMLATQLLQDEPETAEIPLDRSYGLHDVAITGGLDRDLEEFKFVRE